MLDELSFLGLSIIIGYLVYDTFKEEPEKIDFIAYYEADADDETESAELIYFDNN